MTELSNTNDLIAQRRAKLAVLREQGHAFPNNLKPNIVTAEIIAAYSKLSAEELAAQQPKAVIAGRLMTKRQLGKASFAHVQDMSGRLQIYLRHDEVSATAYAAFTEYDLGDIIWVSGSIFKTHTGELSIRVQQLSLLTKSLRPLPDKFHGLTDKELCYRQRYLDLLVNESTKQRFLTRAKIINKTRAYLLEHDFIEVETPMMQALAGGATARPFITHHNTLDMTLYLRIAPELYLKRLVVGGLERVFELNRNFRNEGLSTRHNPEFTMLEFYQAYANYEDLMQFTAQFIYYLALEVSAKAEIQYQEQLIDLTPPFAIFTVVASVLHYCPDLSSADLSSWHIMQQTVQQLGGVVTDDSTIAELVYQVFEKRVEHLLIQPTFIIDLPLAVSPLARANPANPLNAERFELFIAGYEIANGFSELNDPDEQAQRLQQQIQAKNAGNIEAMPYDADYITALEYGLPPTAGAGIGIDRLVMLLTNAASIRDVILFPQLRPVTPK